MSNQNQRRTPAGSQKRPRLSRSTDHLEEEHPSVAVPNPGSTMASDRVPPTVPPQGNEYQSSRARDEFARTQQVLQSILPPASAKSSSDGQDTGKRQTSLRRRNAIRRPETQAMVKKGEFFNHSDGGMGRARAPWAMDEDFIPRRHAAISAAEYHTLGEEKKAPIPRTKNGGRKPPFSTGVAAAVDRYRAAIAGRANRRESWAPGDDQMMSIQGVQVYSPNPVTTSSPGTIVPRASRPARNWYEAYLQTRWQNMKLESELNKLMGYRPPDR
ncbi:hypothetical protein GGR54DRAFT_608998 [Hypoxylon sp. NC1633]|nr:hypothetical protein GGR54DRAFT_608998 [Hypoxylon sp. NC1633]